MFFRGGQGFLAAASSVAKQLADGATIANATLTGVIDGSGASNARVKLPAGSAAAPSLAIGADNTGLAQVAGAFCEIFQGAGVMEYLAGVARAATGVQMQAQDGSPTAPGWSYVAETNTGWERSTGNNRGIRAGSVQQTWASGTLTLSPGTATVFSTGVRRSAIQTKTTNYTLVQSDAAVIFSGTNLTATLPSAPTAGCVFYIKNLDVTALTINRNGKQIDNASSNDSLLQGVGAIYHYDGTGWFRLTKG